MNIEENVYWLCWWSLAAIVTVVIVVCMTVYAVEDLNNRAELAKEPDPMAAVCAYRTRYSTMSDCTVYLANQRGGE